MKEFMPDPPDGEEEGITPPPGTPPPDKDPDDDPGQ